MVRHLSLVLILISACGCKSKSGGSTSTGGRISPTYNGPAETAYCTPGTSYANTITVTGTARYTRRNAWGNTVSGGLGSASTSGSHPATIHPIRRAEIRVTDSSGNVVQCSETGSSGEINFTLPRGSAAYTVAVNSRSYNSYLKASVLNMPERNQFYSLQTTINAEADVNLGTALTAVADGDVLGAAFNILDQLYEANVYLRAQIGGFTSAPKVLAYWERGYNPNSYFGSTSGLSFYLPGYSRLFILGGQDGDLNSSDTDHFDNSVIIHEYGHFLEDALFNSDSPGGSHNGNKIIDPRLAWSEGWGDFFQAAVLYGASSTPYYTDTMGNDDGTTDMYFHTSLETPPLSGGACTGLGDCPAGAGEGNFREFSVARLLWDSVDSTSDTQFSYTDNLSGKFSQIWGVLVSGTNGFNDPVFAFRNAGHLHLGLSALYTSTDYSSVRGVERHTGSTVDYAQYVTTGSSCSDFTLTPVTISGDNGSFSTSDLFRNNDFYHFWTATAGTITLEYEDANSVGPVADLDLYVYNESARFGVSSDMEGYSRLDPSASASATNIETVNSVPAGTHLINVNAYTGSASVGTAVNYRLKFNGVRLCPTAIVH
jgi:hypothetical protein